MKKTQLFLIFFLLASVAFGQTINGRFAASLYTYEAHLSQDESKTFVRNFETLQLKISENKFAFKTRLNFESDLGDDLGGDPRFRFYNFYFEGRDLWNIATLRIGRQSIINSWGGLFDGAKLKLKYSDYSLTTYFGGNVPAYQKLELTDNFDEDYIFGAKFSGNPFHGFDFNVEYVDKNYKPLEYYTNRLDADLNPIRYLVQKNSTQYQFLSADAKYSPNHDFRVNTKVEYDLNINEVSKVQLGGRIKATEKLGFNAYYNYREPRVAYNSIFSVFNYGNTQEVEAGLDYKLNNDFKLIGKFGVVDYEDDNSGRVSVGLNTKYGNISYRKTFGYAGELDAISVYSAKSFMDGKITPSIGLSYTNYKLTEDGESNDLTTFLGGVNVRPWKKFSFDLQGQYFNNKIYSNDFRILFKVNHWFNLNI